MRDRFRYCGLTLESEIPLTGLAVESTTAAPDIEIRKSHFGPDALEQEAYGPNWSIGPREGRWWLGNRVRFRIRRHLIEVDAADADEPLVEAMLLEAPLVMAMIFIDQFCLNGAAAVIDEKAILFSGASGSGRSTAVARLAIKGHEAMTDSLARISFPDSESATIWPQGNRLLLWPHSLELLGLDRKSGDAVRNDLSIRAVHFAFRSTPAPLDCIYWQNSYSGTLRDETRPATAPPARRRFARASTMTAGRLWIPPAGKSEAHFAWCHRVARSCSVEKAPQHFFEV